MDIPALLDSLNMSPTELARASGVSDGHIFDLKSGRRRLTVRVAKKIEAATGRSDFVPAVIAAALAQ